MKKYILVIALCAGVFTVKAQNVTTQGNTQLQPNQTQTVTKSPANNTGKPVATGININAPQTGKPVNKSKTASKTAAAKNTTAPATQTQQLQLMK